MIATAATAVGTILAAPSSAAVRAAETPSAGGSPLDQLLIVSAFTLGAYAVLAWVILAERKGATTPVGRLADAAARLDGGPRWFALPATIAILGALSGAIGVYWDVSYHITGGRDEGPLANPSHYLIFLGLLAIFFGGALSMALARDDLPRRTLRLTRTWRTPIGPVVLTGVALCALAGFPMDDVWHRLFGQDVTEWGPTHVLMIGGTVMLPYALLLMAAEAKQVSGSLLSPLFTWVSHAYLIIGPVAFLLEYAFGVPQFPLIMDVVVMTVGASAGLVWASQRGPLYVTSVYGLYLGVQVLLMGTNAVFGAMSPRFPLLAGGFLAALVLSRYARPTAGYGVLAGAVVGAATVPVEFWWSAAFRPVEWTTGLLPATVTFAVITGAATGVVVTWMAAKLAVTEARGDGSFATPSRSGATGRVPGALALVAVLVTVGVFAWNVPPRDDIVGEADVTVGAVEDGRAYLDVAVEESLLEDVVWFHVLSWQGGGMVRSDLVEVEPGVYRTADPIPVSGDWKSLVRLHTGLHSMVSAPVYLPEDAAIPAPAYEAVDGPRPFIKEQRILQRELKQDVPTWLWSTGYISVAIVFAILLGVVAVGYTLAGRPGSGTGGLGDLHLPRRKTTAGAR